MIKGVFWLHWIRPRSLNLESPDLDNAQQLPKQDSCQYVP